MKSHLYFAFERFLKEHSLLGTCQLLALSGGIDSMALLSLAHQAKKKGLFDFEVIHVDHGWREESGEQAKELKTFVERLGLPFHLFKMSPQEGLNDPENRAREARLSFFKRCLHKRHLSGVMLAHHSDDQAETVLKRLLEGAGLPAMQGLLPIREVEGVRLIRPLLTVPKKALAAFAKELELPILEDSTNQDERYLRNRMRQTLIPTLEAQFGKSVSKNLGHLGLISQELNAHLEASLKYTKEQGPLGERIVFEQEVSEALLRFFLKKWAAKHEQVLSHEAAGQLIYAEIGGDKYVFTDKWVISRECNTWYFIHKPLFLNPQMLIKRYKLAPFMGRQDWKSFFTGHLSCPFDYDQVVCFHDLPAGVKPRLSKKYSESKVPCVLRKLAPIFLKEGEVIFEPLTGQKVSLSA